MGSREYPRLDPIPFCHRLLETGDLDPVYIAVYDAKLDHGHLKRWLVAYWCLFETGGPSYLSERLEVDFWDGLMAAASNNPLAPTGERWPRGYERRHWRGALARDTVKELRRRYRDPEDMVDFLLDGPMDFQSVSQRARSHRGFGQWSVSAVFDILERLGLCGEYTKWGDALYEQGPMKGARLVYKLMHDGEEPASLKEATHWAVDRLFRSFQKKSAPPRYERMVGPQEVETMLCKYKSHIGGRYPVDKDIKLLKKELEPWLNLSFTAKRLYLAAPTIPSPPSPTPK